MCDIIPLRRISFVATRLHRDGKLNARQRELLTELAELEQKNVTPHRKTFFETIKEVQDHATRWLWTYNNDRPNMAIGGITPRQKLTMAA